MGLIDDKKDVLLDIGVFTSIGETTEIPDLGFSLSSVNNKNEIIPFMLDILSITKGSESLERTVGELMTNFIRDVEPGLKDSLKSQTTTFNSDSALPTTFINGYDIDANSIDVFKKLKTDPASQTGSLLYSDTPNNFDVAAYGAITSPGTAVNTSNVSVEFLESANTFRIKPINVSQTIGAFVIGFIEGIEIINETEFTSQILDVIFGTVTTNQNKTEQQIFEEEQNNRLIERLLDDGDLVIEQNELTELLEIAKEKKSGIQSIDVGCGFIQSTVSLDDLTGFTNTTIGNPNPQEVGETYGDLINDSFLNTSDLTENENTIRDGFFKRIINAINRYLLITTLLTPQMKALFFIVNGLKNNNDLGIHAKSTDDLVGIKNTAQCISKSSRALLNEFIFDLVKVELLKIVAKASRTIIREKLNAFLGILKSLKPF